MWDKFLIFLSQSIILWHHSEFVYTQPIIGQNVRPARQEEYPFVVSLMRIKEKPHPQLDHSCMGTLISKRDVLTNSHCVEDESLNYLQVMIGSIYLSRGIKYYPVWWKTFDEWCTNKNMPRTFIINDVAVIRLSMNVTQVHPAILSDKPLSELYGLNVMMPGWGITNSGIIPDTLATVGLKILLNSKCEETAYRLEGAKIPLHKRILCSTANPFALMQFGDSGGPLLYENKVIAVNGGTFPLPNEDVHPEKMNLHFSIAYYRNFILDILNNY